MFVDALNGFPGAFFLCSQNSQFTWYPKTDVPSKERRSNSGWESKKAEFRAVAVLYKGGQTIVSEGVCPGRIAHTPVEGDGFGFDPIFIPADLDVKGEPLPVGEMGVKSTHGVPFGGISLQEKQNYSHRHRAQRNHFSPRQSWVIFLSASVLG